MSSWSSWTVDGYGIDMSDHAPETKKEFEFIGKHMKALEKALDEDTLEGLKYYIANGVSSEYDGQSFIDFVDEYEDEDYGRNGFPAILAEVIREETQIEVECVQFEGVSVVMLCRCMPWEYTEKEKALTKDDLNNIFLPYLQELGLSEKLTPDHQSVEEWG